MATTDTAPLVRWTCEACGESVAALAAAWVEHLRSTHRCPTPERERAANRITEALALQGWFDG